MPTINNRVSEDLAPEISGRRAATLSGRLEDYSTETLHSHSFHQVLTIRNGVSLLVEENRRQPLYGSMGAFIPAGTPHRTVVIGKSVTYQSLYLGEELFKNSPAGIVIFSISELGMALFNRLNEKNMTELMKGITGKCLDLFLKIMAEDMARASASLHLPVPSSPEIKKLVLYIENNFRKELHMSSFQPVLFYSERHIARLFSNDMKVTVFEYIRLYRMFMASVMLHDRGLKVTAIAFECGYESLSNFYTDFKKYFSVTPGEFRKRSLC